MSFKFLSYQSSYKHYCLCIFCLISLNCFDLGLNESHISTNIFVMFKMTKMFLIS